MDLSRWLGHRQPVPPGDGPPAVLLAEGVHLVQALLEGAGGLQAAGLLQQQHRGARVLDAVVRLLLDVHLQGVAGQEAQAQLALVLQVEELHRVDHLRRAYSQGSRPARTCAMN